MKNYQFKVTPKGVTLNDGQRKSDSITFFEGAKSVAEAMAMLQNPACTKEDVVSESGIPMRVVRVLNIVKADLSALDKLKNKAAALLAAL